MNDYYAPEEVVNYWDKRHRDWDETWTERQKQGHFEMKADWFEARFSHILPCENLGKLVLDYGCGCGQYSVPLSRRYGSYTGVDTSSAAIDIAKRYFGKMLNFFEVIEPDKPLPQPDRLFDCVHSITCLQHLPIDWRIRAIQEIKRILRPDGVYVGLEWIGDTRARDMPRMDVSEWVETWKPFEIVPDDPPVKDWVNDHVWIARMPQVG